MRQIIYLILISSLAHLLYQVLSNRNIPIEEFDTAYEVVLYTHFGSYFKDTIALPQTFKSIKADSYKLVVKVKGYKEAVLPYHSMAYQFVYYRPLHYNFWSRTHHGGAWIEDEEEIKVIKHLK